MVKLSDPLDYSTRETQEAMKSALGLVLELRDQTTSPLARKVRLYETTLGLAVIPVLLLRLSRKAWKRARIGRLRST
jgi:hypothetical protein